MGEGISGESIQQDIVNILKTSSGERVDIAYAVYNRIMLADSNKSEVFKFFIEISEDIESSDENHIERIFSEEEKYQYSRDYGKIIDGALEALLKKNYAKRKFYDELWKFIEENPLLDSEKLRAFALYYIWIDFRVPYYELEEGIKMSNDEYSELLGGMMNEIRKARFILRIPTEQKTERASRLVKMLDEIKEERKKAVFMAQILKLSDRSDMILAQLAEGKKRFVVEEK